MKKPVKKGKVKIIKAKAVKKTVKKIQPKTKKVQPVIRTEKPNAVKIEPSISESPIIEQDITQKYKEVKTMLSSDNTKLPDTGLIQEEHKQITYEKKSQGYAVFGVVFSILGFIIPLIAILGIIFGFLSEKHGSRFGKAIVMLGFVAFIINMYIIFGTSFYSIIT